jgi:hypothetical protein
MRFLSLAVVLLLLGAGFLVYLQMKDAEQSFDAVGRVADDLREDGVSGSEIDYELARRMVLALEDLVRRPDDARARIDDLRTISRTAASWAQSAPTASLDLRIAVSLRAAAGELRTYAMHPDGRRLATARQRVSEARAALEGETPPEGAVGGIRDRLDNLQQSQREQYQGLEEELAR